MNRDRKRDLIEGVGLLAIVASLMMYPLWLALNHGRKCRSLAIRLFWFWPFAIKFDAHISAGGGDVRRLIADGTLNDNLRIVITVVMGC